MRLQAITSDAYFLQVDSGRRCWRNWMCSRWEQLASAASAATSLPLMSVTCAHANKVEILRRPNVAWQLPHQRCIWCSKLHLIAIHALLSGRMPECRIWHCWAKAVGMTVATNALPMPLMVLHRYCCRWTNFKIYAHVHHTLNMYFCRHSN